ncbi:hypothetical protein [Paenibacillus thalictri]|uniref:hypothetical protein n=1 Tax=Paenibacillus thalictri TaxID=2527873 RepID=UPI0013EEFAF0|nr:hypothetical protein [Paenibacillus thalictri]
MKWKTQEEEVHYPVLFFIVMTGLSTTRGVNKMALTGFGRDSPWIFFACLLVVLGGVWLSLRISSRYEGESIMLASGRIGPKLLTPVSYLLYAILFWGGAVYYLITGGDFFSRTLLYGNSTTLMISGTLIATLLALFSIETVGRYGHLLMIFIIPLYIVFSLTALMNSNWSYLMPVIRAREWAQPIHGISGAMLMFIPLAAVTVLSSRIKRKRVFVSVSLLASGSALFGAYTVTMGITTFGVHTARQFESLTQAIFDAVRAENFVMERIVFIHILLWKYLEIAGSTFFIRCASFCLAQAFGWKLSPLHIIGVGIGSAIFVVATSKPFFFRDFAYWLGCYGAAMLVAFPLLLYMLMLARGRSN